MRKKTKKQIQIVPQVLKVCVPVNHTRERCAYVVVQTPEGHIIIKETLVIPNTEYLYFVYFLFTSTQIVAKLANKTPILLSVTNTASEATSNTEREWRWQGVEDTLR